MLDLTSTRAKLDQAIINMHSDTEFNNNAMSMIITDDFLQEIGIDDVSNNIPLYAWTPVPSAITACPTCLFKGPVANPRTMADCPPRTPAPPSAPKK